MQAQQCKWEHMCAMPSGQAQVLATEPVSTLTPCPNSLPRYAKSAACACQLFQPPPGLSPPGLQLLDSTREQHPLRSSSRPHLQSQSGATSTEVDTSDAEISSSCSTTDTVPQDGQVSTSILTEPCKGHDGEATDCNPGCVLNLDSAVPDLAPLGSKERPSIGSTCHHLGICRPCAHAFGRAGCNNGPLCNFCHLCGPDDIKRRKKEKQAFQRAMKRFPLAFSCTHTSAES